MFAYNTSRHDSSKFSPFELMFGRRATLTIDIDIRKAGPEEIRSKYVDADEPEDFTRLQEERQKRLEEAKANIRYVGPYKIIKILPKGVYLLQLVANPDVAV